MGSNDISDSFYHLQEARSEISRHHRLIAEFKAAGEWAVELIDYLAEVGISERQFVWSAEDRTKRDDLVKLLNRQVG